MPLARNSTPQVCFRVVILMALWMILIFSSWAQRKLGVRFGFAWPWKRRLHMGKGRVSVMRTTLLPVIQIQVLSVQQSQLLPWNTQRRILWKSPQKTQQSISQLKTNTWNYTRKQISSVSEVQFLGCAVSEMPLSSNRTDISVWFLKITWCKACCGSNPLQRWAAVLLKREKNP